MRPGTLRLLATLLVFTGTAPCQPAADPAPHAREAALEALLSERGPVKALQSAIDNARQAGVSEQAILEARFLYHVDQMEDSALAALLPEFLEQDKRFRLEASAIFAVREDWLSVVEYVKAIDAMEKGDREGFKAHIKEAFWLGPRQAAAFAPHIERLRHEEAMAAITIDFKAGHASLDGSPPVAFSALIQDHKALLLHFWSPHSRECELSLPDFGRTAEMLSSHGIAVASLCAERSPEAVALTKAYNKPAHGRWLIDGEKDSLGLLLRVQELPTMALISNEGRVLYCGDPTDIQFWRSLKQLDATIERPDSEDDFEE